MTKPAFIEQITSNQQVITADQAWHFGIIPKDVSSGMVEFFVDEAKLTPDLQKELSLLLGKEVMLEKADQVIIQATLGKYYRKNGHSIQSRTLGRSIHAAG